VEGKKWYASKTVWVNLIAIVALFLQTQLGFVLDADEQVGILAVINIVLRLFTKEQVNLKTPSAPVGIFMVLVLTTALMTACAGFQFGVTLDKNLCLKATIEWDPAVAAADVAAAEMLPKETKVCGEDIILLKNRLEAQNGAKIQKINLKPFNFEQ